MCYRPGVHHCRRRRRHLPSSLSCRASAASWGLDTPPQPFSLSLGLHRPRTPLTSGPSSVPFALVVWAFHAGLVPHSSLVLGVIRPSLLFSAWPSLFTFLLPRPHGLLFGLSAPPPSPLCLRAFYLLGFSALRFPYCPYPAAFAAPPSPTRSFKSGIFEAALVSPSPQPAPSLWDCGRARTTPYWNTPESSVAHPQPLP